MKQQIAIVALGSNLGDPQQIVPGAMSRLESLSDEPLLKSSLWQTSPVDCPPDSHKFINAVVAFAPKDGETAESLLSALQKIEKEFGRTPKKIPNEPRPLDLDLIAFGQETRKSGHLILPHPRVHLRKFVLEPLNEIMPDLVLPGQRRSVSKVLADLASDEMVVKLD